MDNTDNDKTILLDDDNDKTILLDNGSDKTVLLYREEQKNGPEPPKVNKKRIPERLPVIRMFIKTDK